MTYKNKSELLELLKTNGLIAKKKLGQNFLISAEALNKIIKAADLTGKDLVIEIGPGLGILTQALARKAGRVKSYEIDDPLVRFLQKYFKDAGNVEISRENALKIALPREKYKLVANIPYYITSPILTHFLNPSAGGQKRPSLIVLLVQKEVAEKICVKTGDHSVLSLQVQIFGKPSIAGEVKKNCFYPEPKVDSAILKIEIYEHPIINDPPIFMKVMKAAFSQRRKTLQNSLHHGLNLDRGKVESILNTAGISSAARPQELSIQEWQRLLNALNL